MGKIVDTDDLRKHVRISSEMDEAGFIENFRVIDEDALDRVKAADAEPAVHAHWVPYFAEFKCSNCGGFAAMDFHAFHTVQDKYCRSCGAKMGDGDT